MNAGGKAISVIIADDHILFRESLKKLFDSEKDFLIVGEASECRETLKLVKLLEPDVLLLSWQLAHLTGTDILRSLSAYGKGTKTILLAEEIDHQQIEQVFQMGARGLVLKESSIEVLFLGIRAIMANRYWMGNESFSNLDRILKRLGEKEFGKRRGKNFDLTPQEMKIIAAVASGYTNKTIAKQLSISEQTVKHHVTNIFDKLGVYNRLELTLFAVQNKLIKDSS